MEVIILVGLPAAGKSSYFREHFAATHAHISKDLMRNVRNKEKRQGKLLREALSSGRSVVVDNINASRAARSRIVEVAREFDVRVRAIYFPISVPDSVERNRGVNRTEVPLVAIYSAAKHLEIPSVDEGIDEVVIVEMRKHESSQNP